MKAAAYIWVSSLSQIDGHSLDSQEHSFQYLCKSRNWEAGKVYREEANPLMLTLSRNVQYSVSF